MNNISDIFLLNCKLLVDLLMIYLNIVIKSSRYKLSI